MGDLSEDDLRELQNQTDSEKMARLLAEVRRYRAAVTPSTDYVRTVVREAIMTIVESRWWQAVKRPYAEPEIVAVLVKRITERLVSVAITPITEMRLCEVPHLALHPDQLYRFTVAPGCHKCEVEAGLVPGEAAEHAPVVGNDTAPALVEQLRHACSVAFGDLLVHGMPRGVSTGKLLEAALAAAVAYLAKTQN